MAIPRVAAAALKTAFSVYGETVDRADLEGDWPLDATAVLYEIRDRGAIRQRNEVIALFRRSVALANVMEEAGVPDALGVEADDPIPDFVFEIAATLPVSETEDRAHLATCYFSKQEFLAAVRARRAN